jgi:hypothetical protein
VQDFYRCEEGMMIVAREVANTACHKLVVDMLYEARVQANCDYKRRIEIVKTNKGAVRNLRLTREQYMRVNIQYY